MTKHTAERIVVVGGGISGLSIAAKLALNGFPVTLLESTTLGHAATTRNQGWLYSGAWFAPRDHGLARECYASLKQTLRFCPDCEEPNHRGMVYLLPDASRADEWLSAWHAAGIPANPVSVSELRNDFPGLAVHDHARAWELPDRAFRPDVLLDKLVVSAESAGVEIRTGTPIENLIHRNGEVSGVVTTRGERLNARLVILATNAHSVPFWSDTTDYQAGVQSTITRVALKAHLVAVNPSVSPWPMCVMDETGLNHIPHGSRSVFGIDRWRHSLKPRDHEVEQSEVDMIWDAIRRYFPDWNPPAEQRIAWAGTTVQAMHVDQVEPGRVTLPTLIDHSVEPPRMQNLISVYPGRASLWAQLADETCRVVLRRLDREHAAIANPPWAVNSV